MIALPATFAHIVFGLSIIGTIFCDTMRYT